MVEVNGSTITADQGDDVDIQFPVVDKNGTPYDLTEGAAVLTYWKSGGTEVNQDCSINTTTVSAALPHATTKLMAGTYPYHLRCKDDSGIEIMTVKGNIVISPLKNPNSLDT